MSQFGVSALIAFSSLLSSHSAFAAETARSGFMDDEASSYGSQNTQSEFDARGIQTLFGDGDLPSMKHTDHKYKTTSTSVPCKRSWDVVRKGLRIQKRSITPAQVEKLRQKAASMGLNEKYVKRSLATFLANQDELPNQRHVTFIDFNQKSNQKRMVIMDLATQEIKTFHVAAGKNSDPNRDGYADRFSNGHGTEASSLGCYIANGEDRDGKGRPKLLIHGIEKSNDNACQRTVFMHTASYVGGSPALSHGCPAVRPQDQKEIYRKIGGGGLICAYHDNPREVSSVQRSSKKQSSKSKGKKRKSNGRRR